MKLLIIDSNALLHRSFHALPPLTNKKGEETGAVYGFLLTLFKAINDLQPDFIVATFDFPAPTFRHKKFKEYKAKRVKAPEEFYQQIPKTKEILKAFSIPLFEKEGFEADDLIATIVKKSQEKNPQLEIYILTGDLDTLQLVSEKTKVYTLGRGVKETVIYDEKKIKGRFNLESRQMVDFKALSGDPSDNIPGAKGIGKKTAIDLLKKYDNLENLYQKIEENNAKDLKSRIKDILLKNKEQVFFSQILAKTRDDAPIDFNLEESKFGNFNRRKIEEVLKDFEFFSLLNRIPTLEASTIQNEENKNQACLPSFKNSMKS
ncbi:MAG TPA: 5'-3' exonuclease H3TH domain-containing protein [Candidatus Pacearchaeota archaeon]|nr:5'-3' exonuclease H3TH domain-containing protein [Candidatus Pacearchaeota archaeon]HOK93955.1 5'-3' exonuclease H3TH domain-containing protein [Candidatus Pacearchaeota archaeon]HPO75026.1 5'-3' exonuclease H3TH domain-containing protein [Candidatus Pacearchaeota archaeon]